MEYGEAEEEEDLLLASQPLHNLALLTSDSVVEQMPHAQSQDNRS